MTWGNRFRLWGGTLLVLVLLAGLTLLFNQRRNQVVSMSASVDAPRSVVSSAYGGVVTERFVREGDVVHRGDRLFTVSSATLQEDVAHGVRPVSTPGYDVDLPGGRVTYKAAGDGYVESSQAEPGTFLPNGSPMASVVFDATRVVVAQYALTPLEYGRVEEGAMGTIHLPNQQRLTGAVQQVRVHTDQGRAMTEVIITSPDLVRPEHAALTRRGTPVNAVLKLRDDGPLAGPTDAVRAFLTKIGLR